MNGLGAVLPCRSGRFPAGRQQGTEIVLVGHGRQAFEHVGEVGLRVMAVALGTFHHGVNDGGALAGGFTAHEEPGLFPDRRRPDAAFYPIAVNFKMAVVEIDVEPVPECQRVVDGLAQQTFGQNLWALAQRDQIGLEDDEHRCGLLLAEAESFGGGGAALAQGARRLARSPWGFEPGGADECDHIVHGKTRPKPENRQTGKPANRQKGLRIFLPLAAQSRYHFAWKMACFSTEPASERRNLTGKNRVWDFFRFPNETHPANRREPAQPRRKIRPTATKTASGIPC